MTDNPKQPLGPQWVLMIFGIVLLVIGLVAYFYRTTVGFVYSYPYQGLGTALSILGVIFVAAPLFLEYWSRMKMKA